MRYVISTQKQLELVCNDIATRVANKLKGIKEPIDRNLAEQHITAKLMTKEITHASECTCMYCTEERILMDSYLNMDLGDDD